jgi:hypothetical protein
MTERENEHPDFEPLLRDLIARHGGIDKFSPVQRETAAIIASLMIDMRVSGPGELVRHGEVMTKLMGQLPKLQVPPAELPECPHKITDDMTLHEAAAAYERMLHDVTPYKYPDLTGIDMATALTIVRKGDVLIRLKRLKAGEDILDEVIDEAISEICYLRGELRMTCEDIPGPQIDLKAGPPQPRLAAQLREAPKPIPTPEPSPAAGTAFQSEPGEPGEPAAVVTPLHADPRFTFRALGGNILNGAEPEGVA